MIATEDSDREQRARARRRGPDWSAATGVLCLSLLVGLTRVPFLAAPVSPDEGGFLVVGAQWRPGASLYGGYWVDRPPLLIAVFALADRLGGAFALRMIGILAVAASISAAGAVGWYASGRRSGALASAFAASALLATPLFGTRTVDGELLASPLVLTGLVCLVAAYGRPSRPAVVVSGLAGALGVSAFLIKQDMIDVFVVATVLGAHTLGRRGLRTAASALLPVLAGALVTATAVAALAASRGTSLRGLWTAVVTFRVVASGVASFSGSRLSDLEHAYVFTGALAVTLAAGLVVWRSWRTRVSEPPAPWGVAAVALTTWELAAVFAGGSYWSHYLVGLVPGVVLLVAIAFDVQALWGRRLVRAALVYTAAATVVALCRDPLPPSPPSDDQVTATYVRNHARPGDSMVTAFGHADIVHEAGLSSPYPYLWALPAFVEDPRLADLDALLRSTGAPRWFVAGGNLTQWGSPGASLERVLEHRYFVRFRSQRWVVWSHDP